MFVVRPMQRDADVRSLLGFMSVASRWGDHLFPGITVLTRDLFAIQAMHEVAIQMHGWEPEGAARFRRRETDASIARQLSRNFTRAGRLHRPDRLRQVMSYWQRYGSLFSHFGLLNERRPHAIAWYRDLVYADREKSIGHDTPALRKKRLTHFRWYRVRRRRLEPPADIQRAFLGHEGHWRRWWLTGKEPPSNTPEPIRLVRQLEFFFVIWQTLFEASVRAYSENRLVRLRRASDHDPLRALAESLASYHLQGSGEQLNRRIAELCLVLHDKLIAPRLAAWHKDAVRHFGPSLANPYISLHADRTVLGFREYSGIGLIRELAQLHGDYCELQEKPYAAHVTPLFPFKAQINRVPTISARFSPTRWGLFGYRMQAAVELYDTASP